MTGTMKGLPGLLAATALLWSVGIASAEELSAGDLLDFCKSRDFAVQGTCRFYVLGAVQGVELGDGSKLVGGQFVEKPKTVFCVPDKFPQSAMVNVFVQQAEAVFRMFPQDRKLPAISVLIGVMHRQFPCPPS